MSCSRSQVLLSCPSLQHKQQKNKAGVSSSLPSVSGIAVWKHPNKPEASTPQKWWRPHRCSSWRWKRCRRVWPPARSSCTSLLKNVWMIRFWLGGIMRDSLYRCCCLPLLMPSSVSTAAEQIMTLLSRICKDQDWMLRTYHLLGGNRCNTLWRIR